MMVFSTTSASKSPTKLILFVLLATYYYTVLESLIKIVDASSVAGQDTLVGIVGKDFVMLGADSSCSLRGTLALTASNVDKIHLIRSTTAQCCIAAAAAGNPADSDRLVGLLRAHAALREYEATGVGSDVECVFVGTNGSADGSSTSDFPIGLDVRAVSHLARTELSSSLRTASALQVCLLVAGMIREEEDYQPCLFWLDNTGFQQRVSYGAHGYGSNFIWSILDRNYKPNMSKDEAFQLMTDCFQQLRTRYVMNTGPYPPRIKCIDAIHGCTTMQ